MIADVTHYTSEEGGAWMDEELWHLHFTGARSHCGADHPGRRSTDLINKATCVDCLRIAATTPDRGDRLVDEKQGDMMDRKLLENDGERYIVDLDHPEDGARQHIAMYTWAIELAREMVDRPIAFIDWGCGTGWAAELIHRLCDGAEYYGVDIAQPAIDYARDQRYPGQFTCADLTQSIPHIHATVEANRGHRTIGLCFEVLEHLDLPPAETLLKLLDVTPRIFFSVPHNELPFANPHHKHCGLTHASFKAVAEVANLALQEHNGGVNLLGMAWKR